MPKILLVEDNEMNRDMLSRRLRRLGHEVIVAVDAEEGCDLAVLDQPDIILMDIALPGMDGVEATKLLKSKDETRQIPILVLTAYSNNREAAFEAGCTAYAAKPIAFAKLNTMIEDLIVMRMRLRSEPR